MVDRVRKPFQPPTPEVLSAFCRRWSVAELALFGSALRDDFSAESDVDVLVTFRDGAVPTLFSLVSMERELSTLFGRPVDLAMRRAVEQGVNALRRESILRSARVLHAA